MKILLIEDNTDHRQLMTDTLSLHDPSWEVLQAANGTAGLEKIKKDPTVDLVFLDYSLPGEDGLHVLQQIKQLDDPPAVIMVTGRGDEETAVAVMKEGAYDYVVKGGDYLRRLPVVAQRAFEYHQLARERKQAEEALKASQALNQAVISKSPIGISIRSNTGRLLYANDAWKKIWAIPQDGLAEDYARERKSLVFDHRDDYLKDFQEDIRKLYEHGGALAIEEVKTTHPREGGPEWVSQHFYALENKTGDVERVVILTEDITDRKKAQETLQRWNEELEEQVENRTYELNVLVNSMAGREVRMAELKKAIRLLRDQLIAAGIEPVADDPLLEPLK